MQIKLGTVVVVRNTQFSSNGSVEHPAVVNRVWGNSTDTDTDNAPVMVNVMVLPDCGSPRCDTSIRVYGSREQAQAEGNTDKGRCAWPA